MKPFKVLIKNWYVNEDGTKEDCLIETEQDSLNVLGGYLCLALDGKLKLAEETEGGMNYSDFSHEYEII